MGAATEAPGVQAIDARGSNEIAELDGGDVRATLSSGTGPQPARSGRGTDEKVTFR